MTDVPDDAQLSEDGQFWWDAAGNQWQPVSGGTSESYESAATEQPDQSGTNQISAEEFPAIARALYYGSDPDAYLQDLGIDLTGLDNDEPAEPPLVS